MYYGSSGFISVSSVNLNHVFTSLLMLSQGRLISIFITLVLFLHLRLASGLVGHVAGNLGESLNI